MRNVWLRNALAANCAGELSRWRACGLLNRYGSTPGTHTAEMSLPTPTLHTARLLLRPFTESDTDSIFALHSSLRVLRYWDAQPWSERAQAERFIAVCKQMEQEGSGARLAIERAADGVFIGWCCLVKWNPDYRSATMGYCLDDAAWGQGFATEATGALLQSGPSMRWT